MRRVFGIAAAWGAVTLMAVTVAWLGVRASAPPALADAPNLPYPKPHPSPSTVGPTHLAVAPSKPVQTSGKPSAKPVISPTLRALPPSTQITPVARQVPLPSSLSPNPSPAPEVSPHQILPSPTPESTPSPTPTNRIETKTSSTQYRSTSTTGGFATFSYQPGVVNLVDVDPERGYSYDGYRMAPDYVAIQFSSYSHVSTIYAYWSSDGRATVLVDEYSY